MQHSIKAGFTLIELSIVLVIIGLIVGGVLVGQDLIKASEIRATVSQYEKFNASVYTFRGKYNGLPGDLLNGPNGEVSAFGLCPASGCGTGNPGFGDGNGVLTEGGGANARRSYGEILFFWQQLSAANLLEGNYGVEITGNGAPPVDTDFTTVSNYIPPAKIGGGMHWCVGSALADSKNYFIITGFNATPINQFSNYNMAPNITPIDAFNIDSKIDDGLPNLGIVQARGTGTHDGGQLFEALDTDTAGSWSTATPADAVAGDCMTTGASPTDVANTYARTGSAGNVGGCILRLQFN